MAREDERDDRPAHYDADGNLLPRHDRDANAGARARNSWCVNYEEGDTFARTRRRPDHLVIVPGVRRLCQRGRRGGEHGEERQWGEQAHGNPWKGWKGEWNEAHGRTGARTPARDAQRTSR